MVRSLLFLVTLLFTALPAGAGFFDKAEAAAPKGELSIFSWPDYIDPEIVAEFEKESGIKIKWSYFDDDHDRDTKLQNRGTLSYDLVLAGDKSIERFRQRGWLLELDPAKAPNLENIPQRWKSLIAGAEKAGAPYFWGTSGIVYRKDLVKEPITRWMQLFDPSPELRGHIQMMRDPRELTAAALIALGYEPNTTDADAYEKVDDLLRKQRPQVLRYAAVVPNEDDPLVKGNEIIAAAAFNGDAQFLKKYQPKLEYVVPEEGGGFWMDFLVIMRNSRNQEAAYRFLDFVNRPEIAARNAQFLAYATPNEAARKLLPRPFLTNRAIFPDEATLNRCRPRKNLPSWVNAQLENVVADVVPAE